MSLTDMLNIASSGMRAAQTGMRTASDNVSNVNTPGYVRKLIDLQPVVIAGAGAGVEVAGVRRAADLYLQKATIDASGEVGRTSTVAEFMERAQGLFGDPSETSSFFSRLDPIFNAFSIAGKTPESHLHRSTSLAETTRLFDDARVISVQLRDLSRQAETQIASTVNRVNGLLEDINRLNVEISRATITGRDATGAENVQSQMIDELSGLIDLRIAPRNTGGVALSATDGTPLTGEHRATFLYDDEATGEDLLRMRYEDGQPVSLAEGLGGGVLKGLFELKDTILPALSEQLGEFTARAADALNRSHNAAATVPAQPELVGRQMSVPLSAALHGFAGRTVIALTDAAGVVQRRVDIDFDPDANAATEAGSLRVNGGAPMTYLPNSGPPNDFLSVLNRALLTDPADATSAPMGQASFNDGVLRLSATGGRGVSVADDPARPSQRAGRSFSHYFGLNDLIRANTPTVYDQGLRTTQPHSLTPGGQITFRFNDGAGSRMQDVAVTVPAGPNMSDLLSALNGAPGMAASGAFSLDEAGALRFTSGLEPQVTLQVLRDSTVSTISGAPMSQVFGLGATRGARAEQFFVRPDINADPGKLALAQFDFSAAVGRPALARGDGRGAFNMAQAGAVEMRFERAGDIADVKTSLSSYAAQLGGVVGRRSQMAQERQAGAEIIANEAAARRSSAEGVNLDEELVQLTVYQQSYNASARLILAAKEMFEVLTSLI